MATPHSSPPHDPHNKHARSEPFFTSIFFFFGLLCFALVWWLGRYAVALILRIDDNAMLKDFVFSHFALIEHHLHIFQQELASLLSGFLQQARKGTFASFVLLLLLLIFGHSSRRPGHRLLPSAPCKRARQAGCPPSLASWPACFALAGANRRRINKPQSKTKNKELSLF